jgi:excisionase family DNA binding protein
MSYNDSRITPSELARKLGMHRNAIYSQIKQGKLLTVRSDGRTFMVRDAAFDAYVARRTPARHSKSATRPKDTSPKIKDIAEAARREGLQIEFEMTPTIPVPLGTKIIERIEKLRSTQVIAPPLPEFAAALVNEALTKRGL